MAGKTGIEWTEDSWNPIVGCSVISPGCTNCYAMKMADRIQRMEAARNRPTPYAGTTIQTKAGPVWNGTLRQAPEATLLQPLRWKRPRMIFVNSMSDLFHDSVPDEWIDQVFAVMALCPQHTFQVLTKRAGRMRDYMKGRWQGRVYPHLRALQPIPKGHTRESYGATLRTTDGTLPNVWLGVSVEDQTRADERIPLLLDTPAAVRWISAEPLLGIVDLTWIAEPDDNKDGVIDALLGCNWVMAEKGYPYQSPHPDRRYVKHRRVVSSSDEINQNRKLDWVVTGGESGKGARPMHPDWARSLRDQCAAAGVPFFFKQWGEWAPIAEWSFDRSRKQTAIHATGERVDDCAEEWPADGQRFWQAGKARAGDLLDGIQHHNWPEVAT
jgi:protein gp37